LLPTKTKTLATPAPGTPPLAIQAPGTAPLSTPAPGTETMLLTQASPFASSTFAQLCWQRQWPGPDNHSLTDTHPHPPTPTHTHQTHPHTHTYCPHSAHTHPPNRSHHMTIRAYDNQIPLKRADMSQRLKDHRLIVIVRVERYIR
jgi:hypothetical protein